MDKTDRGLEKLKILLHAVQSLEDEESDFMIELEEAANTVINENPGIRFEDWIDTLMTQYPLEVVDALGTDEEIIRQSLLKIWARHFKAS